MRLRGRCWQSRAWPAHAKPPASPGDHYCPLNRHYSPKFNRGHSVSKNAGRVREGFGLFEFQSWPWRGSLLSRPPACQKGFLQKLPSSSTGGHQEKAIAKGMELHRKCGFTGNSEISVLYRIERGTNPRKRDLRSVRLTIISNPFLGATTSVIPW